ncbi:MAG TPA: dihydroneopterin aldolase [Burkholderiaceae bacterium]|jgi:dihydroneopterin aldolase|nr:dihydroneopterin aldolase [Burkholderiaceae bacterium]
MNGWLLDPRLAQCRRIYLREALFEASIGVYDRERAVAQRLMVNVDLFVSLSVSTPRHDRVEEVVDYDFVRETIRRRLGRGHINLQETLVDDLAQALLEHPGVVAVRVCTEKPDVYEDVAGVGIEVLRFKESV